MNKSNKIISIAAVVAGVVIVGLALGWFATRNGNATAIPPANPNTVNSSAQPDNKLAQANPPTLGNAKPTPKLTVRPREKTNSAARLASGQPTAASGTNGIPDWEDKVEEILIADTEDNDKVKKMAEMFPQLSAEGQEEVAHHLSNLTSDEDYAPLGRFLTNSTLSADVLDVFYEDVLNRPNALKLPLLLQVAQDPQHPNAEDAHDVLELFLDEDYGKDWSKWQSAMDAWLKENPD
jgi:hypothetical protein